MDGLKKDISSSTPIKPSVIPRISSPDLRHKTYFSKEGGEINEEGQNFQQMGLKLQNPKRSSTKNFMSPTISAASKATVPRKILAERNEASSSISFITHVQETSHIDSKTTSAIDSKPTSADLGCLNGYSTQITHSSIGVSEWDDDERNVFVPDSLSQPYDPLTNYLSPRPRFLRYKPKRRLEIFLRRDDELKKGETGLRVNQGVTLDSQKPIEVEALINAYAASSSSSQEGSAIQEDGSSTCTNKSSSEPSEKGESNDGEEDDDIEEVEEEEGHWHFSEVLKYLLLFGVLILSTLYISSMNSPTPPPSLQALWNLKEGYQKIQDRLLQVAVENFKVGSNFFNQTQENNRGIMETSERVMDEGLEWEKMITDEMIQLFVQVGETAEDSYNEMEITDEFLDQLAEVLELRGIETAEISESYQVSQTQLMSGSVEFQNAVSNVCGSSEAEVNSDKKDHTELKDAELIFKAEQEESDAIIESTVCCISEAEENLDKEAHTEPTNAESDLEAEQEESETMVESTERIIADEEIERDEMVEDEMQKMGNIIDGIGDKLDGETAELSQPSSAWFVLERLAGDENTDSDISNNPETEASPPDKEQLTEFMIESISEPTVGIPILSAIVASVVLGFLHLMRGKTSAKESSKTVQPSTECTVVKNSSSKLQKKDEYSIEKGDSYFNPSTLVHSEEKAPKKLYQSRGPTVELLGEYVVEEEFSSSLKSCTLKSKTIEEGAESNSSVSKEKKSRRKVLSPYNVNSSFSEFSATESPSCGSFIAREKFVKKEEGRDGEEVTKIFTTPVRRSSRIRNRAVMSP